MPRQIQPAVVGATGYAGFELARLLLHHPRAKKPVLFTREGESGTSAQLDDIYPHISGNGGHQLQAFNWDALRGLGVDVLFLATPHEVSREWAPEALRRGAQGGDLTRAWGITPQEARSGYCFLAAA